VVGSEWKKITSPNPLLKERAIHCLGFGDFWIVYLLIYIKLLRDIEREIHIVGVKEIKN